MENVPNTQQPNGAARTRIRVKEPPQYNVILHNDNETTMDFVVELLMKIFHKPLAVATALMLSVHEQGQAVVGTYSYDQAKTLQKAGMLMARQKGFPLRITVENV